MNKDNAKDYLPLVQALAEGKTVQLMTTSGWQDVTGNLNFFIAADQYRIKPESRDIWVNCHEDGRLGANFYESKEEAAAGIFHGWTPVLFREVIE